MKTKHTAPGAVTRREYLGYFSYGFGQCFSYGLLGSFILFFYTDILGISALAPPRFSLSPGSGTP